MKNDTRYDVELDCVGLFCPMPISMTKEKMDEISIGQILRIIADDPAAKEDISRWAKRMGHRLIKIEKDGAILTFYIEKK